jgi:acyl dehydratase
MTRITFDHRFAQVDFDLFAAVSGDNNPIHVDPAFSARTHFGRTVSHGMLLYTVIWGLVQKQHPGARQLSQSLMFPNPTYAEEPLRFALTELPASPGRQRFKTQVCRISDGAVVLDGGTEIALP